jgi:hypothetical protein
LKPINNPYENPDTILSDGNHYPVIMQFADLPMPCLFAPEQAHQTWQQGAGPLPQEEFEALVYVSQLMI